MYADTTSELIALPRRHDAPAPRAEVEETEDFERMGRDGHTASGKPPTRPKRPSALTGRT